MHLQLHSSPPLQAPLLEGAQVESRVHEPLQLVQVSGLGSCGGSGCRVSPNIPSSIDDKLIVKFFCDVFWAEGACLERRRSSPDGPPVGHHCEEPRPDVVVVAHVLVLLLTPDQLCVGVLFCLHSDQVERERGDLRRGSGQ